MKMASGTRARLAGGNSISRPRAGQLPVHSPVQFRSILSGFAGALGYGSPLQRLQTLILQEYGCLDLLLLDSGTTALALAIRGALVHTGSSTVAIPNYSCFDVATAAISADAQIVLYDICPDTLGPDFESLEAALETGCGTVVAVHLYGVPVDLDRCRGLCEKYGGILIEDAAQGVGGSWRGEPLGSIGDLGILSFGRGKGRTGGGGGALLANSAPGHAALEVVRHMPRAGAAGIRSLVLLAAQFVFGRPGLYRFPAAIPSLNLGKTIYKEPWEPSGMARGSAAALLENWGPAIREALDRRERASSLFAGLCHSQSVTLPRFEPAGSPGYLRFPVVVQSEAAHDIDAIPGVGPPYPAEIGSLPAVQGRIRSIAGGSGARVLTERLRTLPTHRWAIRGTSR